MSVRRKYTTKVIMWISHLICHMSCCLLSKFCCREQINQNLQDPAVAEYSSTICSLSARYILVHTKRLVSL